MKFLLSLFVVLSGVSTSLGQNFDSLMQAAGLRDIRTYDTTLLVELRYATSNNFVGKNMYGSLSTAYVQPEIGEMVALVHAAIKAQNPNYRLLILDAARPMSVQKVMHDVVEGTPLHIYVANPIKGGGRHNYGVAVDATIVELRADGSYRWIDMGAGYDDFRPQSHNDAREKGLITATQQQNRDMLIVPMKAMGFGMINSEWWHFQKYSMDELPTIYPRLDF